MCSLTTIVDIDKVHIVPKIDANVKALLAPLLEETNKHINPGSSCIVLTSEVNETREQEEPWEPWIV